MKKKILAGILAALMVATAGCGTTADTSGDADSAANETTEESSGDSGEAFTPSLDTEEEVTLNIIGPLENFEALEAVISDFQEIYPNCEVVYSYVADYREILAERLASDDTVGVFMTNSLVYGGDTIVSACVDLTQEDVDTSAIQQAALNSYTVDGVLYAVPAAQNMAGLVVNKDLLEDEGIEIPTNYEEFMAACETLKNDGYTPIQGYWGNVYDKLLQSMEYVTLEKAGDVETVMTEFASGDESRIALLKPAFERLTEIKEAGYISDEVNAAYEDNYNDAILEFFEGDVPFLAATTETFSGMKKRETKSEAYSANQFEYSFISAPIGDEDSYCYVENWWGFSANENCPEREWAVEFLRFFATQEQLNQLASVKGLPSVAIESGDERFADAYAENEDYLQYGNYNIPEKVTTAIYNANNALGSGEVDVDGALAQLQAELTGTGETTAETE